MAYVSDDEQHAEIIPGCQWGLKPDGKIAQAAVFRQF